MTSYKWTSTSNLNFVLILIGYGGQIQTAALYMPFGNIFLGVLGYLNI